MDEPEQVLKRALDVLPHYNGIWCSVADGDDGRRITFMLDTHNFYSIGMQALPDCEGRMTEMKIRRTEAEIEGAKRSHVPYVIEWKCPKCGAEHEDDFSDRYLSYPIWGKPTTEHLYCDECEHEEPYSVIADVSLSFTSTETWDDLRQRRQDTSPIPTPVPPCCESAKGADHVAPGVWWEEHSRHKGHERGWTVIDEVVDDDKMLVRYKNVDRCPYCDEALGV